MNDNRDDMTRIMAAVTTLQAGDIVTARTALRDLWNTLREHGTPTQRCTIAHFLADTEDEVDAELAWDLLALQAATGCDRPDDSDALTSDLESFLPSLHLNIGDAYRRLGNLDRARDHARFGLARTAALPPGGYGDMVRNGLERLLARLSEAEAS